VLRAPKSAITTKQLLLLHTAGFGYDLFPVRYQEHAYNGSGASNALRSKAFGRQVAFLGNGQPTVLGKLDRKRPTKKVGFVINLGRKISPIVTPDQPVHSSPCSATEPTSERATPAR
jgi:hypothetical protein